MKFTPIRKLLLLIFSPVFIYIMSNFLASSLSNIGPSGQPEKYLVRGLIPLLISITIIFLFENREYSKQTEKKINQASKIIAVLYLFLIILLFALSGGFWWKSFSYVLGNGIF